MLERSFDRFEIIENIRMVEFEIVEDGNFREVMEELAALVEERSIVFVSFNNKPLGIGESGALPEIVRHAADEEAGIESIVFEYPGQQRSGGGLAMGAGDDNGALSPNEKFFEQLGQGTVMQL